MGELRSWRVCYAYADYVGIVIVTSWEDLEQDEIIRRARQQFFRKFGPPLPMAYEKWEIGR